MPFEQVSALPAKALLGTIWGESALHEPLLLAHSSALLPWTQWQPGNTTVTDLNQKLKALPPDRSQELAEQTLPTEYLMRLAWCSIIAEPGTTRRFESNQIYMSAIAPWLALHQSIPANGLATLLMPSSDIHVQAQTVSTMDKRLCAALSQDQASDTDQPQLETLISSLVTGSEREKHFFLGNLGHRKTAIVTSLELGKLKDHNPSNPYIHLIKAFCHENKREEKPRPEDIAQAGAELVNGAMLGSDCAVWHFARLALQKDSPLALERVIDLYLLQYQRTRRHSVHFDFPASCECSQEHRKIIEAIRNVCLRGNSKKLTIDQLIRNHLIPTLKKLEGSFASEETNYQVSLLLSVCYQKRGKNRAEALFSRNKQAKLPINLQQQWAMHRHIAYLNSLETAAPLATNPVSLSGDNLSYRMLPYIPSTPINTRKQLRPFSKWHERNKSWHELPAMMGRSELTLWQSTHCHQVFEYEFQDNTSTLYPLPGDKSLEHFQNVLYCKYSESVLNGTRPQFPLPENLEELGMTQFWYDQYCIEAEELNLPNIGLAESPTKKTAPLYPCTSTGPSALKRFRSTHSLPAHSEPPQRPSSR